MCISLSRSYPDWVQPCSTLRNTGNFFLLTAAQGDKILDEDTPTCTPKLRMMRRAEVSQENYQERYLSFALGAEK